MNEEYKKAPKVLTVKDLDYLKDIFGWHHTIYKYEENAIENIDDKEIVKNINECIDLILENMNEVISILEDGGYFEQ